MNRLVAGKARTEQKVDESSGALYKNGGEKRMRDAKTGRKEAGGEKDEWKDASRRGKRKSDGGWPAVVGRVQSSTQ